MNSSVGITNVLANEDSVLQRNGIEESVKGYEKLFDGARASIGKTSTDMSVEKRSKEYQTLVNSFYNLVTDFYQIGWGQSFHFAPRFKNETFEESIKRAEYFLALNMGIGKGDKVLDVGCGVGGPMRNISKFSGADVTGITINDYQVRVGNKYCADLGLENQCRLIQGDFQKIGERFEAGTFDAAYAIEATCHSPDRVQCFNGVAKALKKGGTFVGYEWVMLPECGYNKNNPDHLRVKEGIEVGNGLPTLTTGKEVKEALEAAGFEVITCYDANQNQFSKQEIPWFETLAGRYTFRGFRMTRLGRICTHLSVSILEFLGIAPTGSTRVSALLNATALDLVEGGQKQLFTPSYFFKAVKK